MANISEFKNAYENPFQRKLLLNLFSTEFIRNNFFLTGGTALSVFYAGHRRSRDLDLFLLRKISLLEYIRLFRDIAPLITVISESPSFCSYIYEGGIKVDYVFDKFSCSGSVSELTIDGVKINVDIPQNIAINKISAVVSRSEPKDIVDLTWLFTGLFNPERDFLFLFQEAVKREALLEDYLFVKGVFNYISINSDRYLDILKPSLLINISPREISLIFESFEKVMEGLIK